MQSLPFVDADTVRPSLADRQVTFRAKKDTSFDLEATKTALREKGYDDVKLVTPAPK